MASDRIELANQIFSEALEVETAERSAFILQRCGGDESLGQTVLNLLSHYGKLGDFSFSKNSDCDNYEEINNSSS